MQKYRRVKDESEGIQIPEAMIGLTLPMKKISDAFSHISKGPNWLDEVSDPVVVPEKPSITEHQTLTHDATTSFLVDGVWTIPWVIVDVEQDAAYLDERKRKLVERIGAKRYMVEVGGISVGGLAIETDRETQINISQVKQAMDIDANMVVEWKMSDGGFKTLDKLTVDAIYAATVQHKQSCFSQEKTLTEEANAATTLAELDAIDIDAGWPTNA